MRQFSHCTVVMSELSDYTQIILLTVIKNITILNFDYIDGQS